jgi:hypothetical protein
MPPVDKSSMDKNQNGHGLHDKALARIATPEEASRLVKGMLATMQELEKVLQTETAFIREGRIREGLSDETRKTELSSAYISGLESVKSNAIALARYMPDGLEQLKSAHVHFGEVVETNQIVLATARAVSESLVKGISDELSRLNTPQTYGRRGGNGGFQPIRPEPLIVSKGV